MDKPEQIAKFKEMCKLFKVDTDLLDFEAEVDGSLTYDENKAKILELIGTLAKQQDKIEADKKVNKKSIKEEKREQERVLIQEIQKAELHTQKEFEKSLEKIKFESSEVLDRAFYTTKKIVETLIKSKNINGLIIKGESGLGKSYTCLKVFNDMKIKREDYDILSSYCTPLELYNFLYKNREGKILLLDDIMKIFENELSIGILLSALWGEGTRVVNYHTTSAKLTIPKSFIFNSKIIWCLNKLPRGLENIKSRCYFYTLEFDYKEKIMLLYELAKIRKIPLEVVDFIYENSDEMTPNLDFRLLLKVYDIKQNNDDWEKIASALLNKNEKLATAKKILMTGAYTKDMLEKWTQETGLSARQFRRYKAVITENKPNLH